MSRKPSSIEIVKPRIDGHLSASEAFEIIRRECKSSTVFEKGRGDRSCTVFTPHAWETFCALTNFGKVTPENELEMQYYLEGYYFVDKFKHTVSVITNVISIFSVSQGRASAQLYSEGETNTYEFVKKKEEELTKYSCAGKDFRNGTVLNPFYKRFGAPHRIGLGHIHPEEAGCFFSSVDKTSVFAAPGEPWITMVACPRKRDIISGTGSSLESSKVVAFDTVNEKETAREKTEVVTTHIKDITIDQLLKIFQEAYKESVSVSFNIIGKIPGRVKFKGAFSSSGKKHRN